MNQNALRLRHRIELVACAWILGFGIGVANLARHVTRLTPRSRREITPPPPVGQGG